MRQSSYVEDKVKKQTNGLDVSKLFHRIELNILIKYDVKQVTALSRKRRKSPNLFYFCFIANYFIIVTDMKENKFRFYFVP